MVTEAAAGHKPSNQPKHLMVGLYFLMAELYYLMIELYFLMLELYFFLIMESWLLQNVGFHRSFLSFHKIISIQNLKSGYLQMSVFMTAGFSLYQSPSRSHKYAIMQWLWKYFRKNPASTNALFKEPFSGFFNNFFTSMEHDWVNYVQM